MKTDKDHALTKGALVVDGGMFPDKWPPVVGVGKCAGSWILPGSSTRMHFSISTPLKPSWIHRMFMRLLLGWKWVPNAK